jgi:hypothetical protein
VTFPNNNNERNENARKVITIPPNKKKKNIIRRWCHDSPKQETSVNEENDEDNEEENADEDCVFEVAEFVFEEVKYFVIFGKEDDVLEDEDKGAVLFVDVGNKVSCSLDNLLNEEEIKDCRDWLYDDNHADNASPDCEFDMDVVSKLVLVLVLLEFVDELSLDELK